MWRREGPKSSPLWSWAHSAHGWNSEPPPRHRRQNWRELKPPASQGAHAQRAQLCSQTASTIQRSCGHRAQEPAWAPGGPAQGLRGAGARRAPGEREPESKGRRGPGPGALGMSFPVAGPLKPCGPQTTALTPQTRTLGLAMAPGTVSRLPYLPRTTSPGRGGVGGVGGASRRALPPFPLNFPAPKSEATAQAGQ